MASVMLAFVNSRRKDEIVITSEARDLLFAGIAVLWVFGKKADPSLRS